MSQTTSTPFHHPRGLFHSSGTHTHVNATTRTSCRMMRQDRMAGGDRARACLLHQAIVDAHQLRVVVVFENELSWPQLRLVTKQNPGAEVALQLVERGSDIGVRLRFGRRSSTAGS